MALDDGMPFSKESQMRYLLEDFKRVPRDQWTPEEFESYVRLLIRYDPDPHGEDWGRLVRGLEAYRTAREKSEVARARQGEPIFTSWWKLFSFR